MASPSPARTAALVLGAGFLVLFIGGGARLAIGLTMKPMVDEYGWTRSDIGIAVAVSQVVSALCLVVAGRLADRLSIRLILVAGLAAAALGIGLMGAVTQPWHVWLLFGIVFGIGSGIASVTPVWVMVSRAIPHRTGLANSVVTSGMSVGQLVTIAVLTGVLVQVGWRPVFVWLGITHAVLIPLILLAIPSDRGGRSAAARPSTGSTVRQAARTRQFWLLLVIWGICGFDDFFVTTHVVAFAQDGGVDALLAGQLLALMGLTALIGLVGAGWWSDRSGPLWPTFASFAFRLVVFVLLMFDQSPLSIAVFALVFGLTFMITAPMTVLFVRDSFGAQHLGVLSGVITMVHQIFGGVGAYFGAVVFDVTGRYDTAFMVMLVLTLVASVLTLFLKGENPSRKDRLSSARG